MLSRLPLLASLPVLLSAQTFEISASKNVMITTRDGLRLSTDVYRPARNGVPMEGKLPTLLERTPYNKDGGAGTASYFVPRGYVVVVQDVRGRYKSEGHWRPIADDPNDGFDTAKWIGEQPWSDGSIGTIGTSYA
ncbi:MAG TPA: CocE/NonD family hydrolase, partial [Bryobacteraceae bacterium]|nr:CocE/NonD family hydrolase [Bryobacteraceae bacterium]